ncbi:MAG: helix-turn-helix domain-containing protein [Deltaproteobacteria bacterium]|nr:helix-turn-helix domain-containing protein [Deltaproteobacteria bacterium]
MKCYRCQKATMKPGRGMERYEEAAGLPYPVLLANVPVLRCASCGEEAVSIPDAEALHRAIARYIVASRRPLFAGEIRFLRKLLGWTAAELGREMGLDEKTISRWENRKKAMGTVADRLLRMIVRDRALDRGEPDLVGAVFPDILRERRPPEREPVRLRATRRGWRQTAA